MATKVLVALRNHSESSRFAESLREVHDLHVIIADPSHAVSEQLAARPDVAILDDDAVRDACIAMPELRAVALVPGGARREAYAEAFEAGAVDVLRPSADADEIAGRVANASASKTRPGTAPIRRAKAWHDLEAIIARELGELLGTTLRAASAASRQLVHTSAIPLTSVTQRMSLNFGLGIDERTNGQLRDLLLGGDPSTDAMQDALREMCNTAGGAIRRAALDDGMSLSVGLPSDKNSFGSTSESRIFTITDGKGVQIECAVQITTNAPARVGAQDLCEGMVLACDIKDVSGGVVHPRGTVLTATTISSIAELMGNATTIDITHGTPA
jgi:hypothetical protein